jgi:glycosyltransferase involved in cell wall biosynthesis
MDRRPRILHLIPTLEGGGAERQLALLGSAQARRGWEVHLGLLRLGPHAVILDGSAVRTHQSPHGGHYDPRLAAWTLALARRTAPDVVHTWMPMMDVLGGVTALMLRVPWVLSERASSLAYEERWRDRVVRRRLGRRADAVVANSETGLRYWNGEGRGPRVRRVIRNAMDLERIKAAAPSDWPGAAGGPRVLFAGRLAPQKNVLTFIKALARLRTTQPFSAFILGEGPDLPTALAMVAATDLGDRVRFTGYREDIWGLMKAASVFVSPSQFEGHPNVVLEAVACTTPLVVSDIPEHREFLDERTALLVPPDDDEALARALAQVFAEPERARARAAAARPLVGALTIEQAAAQYDEVYQAVRKTA